MRQSFCKPYEETESVEAVTKLAAALLAGRPSDHVRRVA
jgi:hypothetical protein